MLSQVAVTSETMQIVTLVAGIGGPVLAAGAAFFAVKFGLNGARADIREIKEVVRELDKRQHRQDVSQAEMKAENRDTRGRVGVVEDRLERHLTGLRTDLSEIRNRAIDAEERMRKFEVGHE